MAYGERSKKEANCHKDKGSVELPVSNDFF